MIALQRVREDPARGSIPGMAESAPGLPRGDARASAVVPPPKTPVTRGPARRHGLGASKETR